MGSVCGVGEVGWGAESGHVTLVRRTSGDTGLTILSRHRPSVSSETATGFLSPLSIFGADMSAKGSSTVFCPPVRKLQLFYSQDKGRRLLAGLKQ